MQRFAITPEPPYYSVIFTSQRTEGDQGYGDMADRMMALARAQEGFLGAESTRDASGFGITVSYWANELAIVKWKAHMDHLQAQAKGKSTWYTHYEIRVAKVERAYAKS
jgi:heme-degrading monooxygenase HmoA